MDLENDLEFYLNKIATTIRQEISKPCSKPFVYVHIETLHYNQLIKEIADILFYNGYHLVFYETDMYPNLYITSIPYDHNNENLMEEPIPHDFPKASDLFKKALIDEINLIIDRISCQPEISLNLDYIAIPFYLLLNKLEEMNYRVYDNKYGAVCVSKRF